MDLQVTILYPHNPFESKHPPISIKIHIFFFLFIFDSATDTEPPQTEVIAQLAQEIYSSNLLLLLIESLRKVDFEVCTHFAATSDPVQSKKDIVLIFAKILRREIGQRLPTVEYICTNEQILAELMRG